MINDRADALLADISLNCDEIEALVDGRLIDWLKSLVDDAPRELKEPSALLVDKTFD